MLLDFCTYGVLECTVLAEAMSVKMLLVGIPALKNSSRCNESYFDLFPIYIYTQIKKGCNPEREGEAIPWGTGRTVDLEGRQAPQSIVTRTLITWTWRALMKFEQIN
jgi:hypothetical protein